MRIFIALLLVIISLHLSAQQNNSWITVSGVVTDGKGNAITNLMVVNQRTRTGQFGDFYGNFTIKIKRSDTLILGASQHRSIKLCFVDSISSNRFTVVESLEQLVYDLPVAQVFSERDLTDIQKDIDKLGYNKKDHVLSGVSPLQSPITYLYQMMSKKEQSKRKVIEMKNDDRRRDLLKELFQKYVSYDIIELTPLEFDGFIDFLNVSDELLQNTNQYDFILYVKAKYERYSRLNDYKR